MKRTLWLQGIRAVTTAGLFACATLPPAARAFDWRANERSQQEASSLLQQAYAAHESGNSTAALALLDQADRLRPNIADSANLRGTVYLHQGAFDKAEAAFARAVACDPNLWAARFNLAEVPFRQKNYERARARFDALVAQTNRFKEGTRWELAQYKAFLCCLLLHDDAGAQKRVARLPTGAAAQTPARLCAEAAFGFARKDNAAATRLLTDAQAGKYKADLAALFFRALEQAGWLSAPPPSPLGSNTPALAAATTNYGAGMSRGGTAPGFVPMQNVPIPEPDLPVADGAAPQPVSPTVNRPASVLNENPPEEKKTDATLPIP